jgi:hypothetical protein
VDVTRIIGAQRQDIQETLGGSLDIVYLDPGDLADLPQGGTSRNYRVGRYTVAINYDLDDIATGVQVMRGLAEDGYQVEDWPDILARLGLRVDEPPDRAAPAGMHWDDFGGYAISLYQDSPDGAVWSVLVYRRPQPAGFGRYACRV